MKKVTNARANTFQKNKEPTVICDVSCSSYEEEHWVEVSSNSSRFSNPNHWSREGRKSTEKRGEFWIDPHKELFEYADRGVYYSQRETSKLGSRQSLGGRDPRRVRNQLLRRRSSREKKNFPEET